jgi:lichenan operon transcriptional antiterminator
MNLLNKREVEILHLLMNSKGYQTGKGISVLLDVSSRTIRNDIKKLNTVLSKHGASIISHKGIGYELEIYEENFFGNFYKEYVRSNETNLDQREAARESSNIKEEMIRKLLMNSLTGKSIYQEELAEELYISLSSLKSNLPLVKAKMEKFDLEIVTDRIDGIKILGDEDKIRFCMSEYLFNNKSINVYNDLFPQNEIELLKEITLNALLKHQMKLTDVALESLIIHTEITIRRSLNNRQLTFNPTDIERLRETKEFIVANEIIDTIHSRLNINIGTEIFYITQHLLASGRLSSSYIDSNYSSEIEVMLQDVMYEINQKTSIDFSKDQKLMEGLIIHLSVALKRIEYQMNIRNEVLNSIKNNYPLAFQLAAIASKTISKITNLVIDENEIGFLAIHFGVALEKKGLNKQNIKNIIIVCGSGLATATLIREKILTYYGQQVNVVETISLAEFNEKMLDEVDTVVSTVPIPEVQSEKIIMINPIISNKDLSTIKNRVIDKGIQTPLRMYTEVFKKELFIKNLDLHTKEEVLHYITSLMMEKSYIDTFTRDSIYEREKLASTELCNLLAIPHPLDNNMMQTAIAVCILNKPITWGREKVQVVIVLSVSKVEQKSWEIIFKQLYRFLIEEFGITKLISEYNYEKFISNLTKYKE